MGLSFIDRSFDLDYLKGKGIIVVDVSAQGVWEFNELKELQWAFPRTYNYYLKMCLLGQCLPGHTYVTEEEGYKIALMVTKTNRKEKSPKVLLENFENCVKDFIRLVPSDIFVYSPILGREDKMFVSYMTLVKKLISDDLRNWFIVRKKGNDTYADNK